MNGADLFVKTLEDLGTEVVFGYPGGTVLSIYDALYREKTRIRHIRTAHEQGAAHAADGYARVSGKTGVCIATSGPGATNLVTGIANAYMDSVPVVFFTGNVELSLIGTDSFQEVDITGITLPVTKHNFMVKRIEDLVSCVRDAFAIANSGRKGPVLVDLPQDILEGKIARGSNMNPADSGYTDSRFRTARETPQADLDPLFRRAAQMLNQAERPLILVGGGIKTSRAADSILKLAEKVQAPICSSLMATGEIPFSHTLYLGNLGVYGNPCANQALQQCDLLLAFGTRFSNRLAANDVVSRSDCKVIHIDTDRAEIKKVLLPDCYIVCDAKAAAEALYPYVDAKEPRNFATKQTEQDEMLSALHTIFGEDAYVVTDVGLHQMWTARCYPFEKSGHFITSGGLGTMGFGLGAAIGVQTAQPDKPVILITGDGSFSMNAIELATVSAQRLPIVIVVIENGCLGMVHTLQKKQYHSRYSETVLKKQPNFAALARAYHIKGYRVKTTEEFIKCACEIQERRIPALIDVRIGRNAIC